ncbi:tyrosine-type recombinase/integrase (plasmid) [Novosphingobium sp. BL-8A]
MKLTKRILDAAAPKAKAYELRDTAVVGLICKVTPAGRKTFMLQYRTCDGRRRKPALGLYGELTIQQARAIAQRWLAEVRSGADPSRARAILRASMPLRQYAEYYYAKWTLVRNKENTQKSYRYLLDKYIIRKIGSHKVASITRRDVEDFLDDLVSTPGVAYVVLIILNSMFNRAEEWGFRSQNTNPCKGITTMIKKKRPRLIRQDEMVRLMDYLELPEGQGGAPLAYSLAMRLQFAFAARASEILQLRWTWIDFDRRRIEWPDSKTGPMWKPISNEARNLLDIALSRAGGSPFVVSNSNDPAQPIQYQSYRRAWKKALQVSCVEYVGTHGIRHRAATDIANSGVPIKVGMALTAHRQLSIFMAYVHLEESMVYEAADHVADYRLARLSAARLGSGKGRESREM